MGGITNLALRGFQLLFGIVVLGLSATLIAGHRWGGLPATLGFAAFVGAVIIIGSIIGIASKWVSMLEGKIGMLIDAVVALIATAGGILMALKLKGVQCKAGQSDDNGWNLIENDMLNGGCIRKLQCFWFDKPEQILSHCRSAQADAVFMFLTVVLLIVVGVLAFLRAKRDTRKQG